MGEHNSIDDLASIDKNIHKNILFTKKIKPEDVEQLCLTMTIDEEHKGVQKTINLVPGGDQVDVNGENRDHYIEKYVDFKFNVQTATQNAAFAKGLHAVLPDFTDQKVQECLKEKNLSVYPSKFFDWFSADEV
jgi:HECT-domain (ubiquitin-transferase)